MNILALEPYYGGSHQAFLDGWRAHSRHHWTIWGLPANKWKWRMRHAAITWSQAVLESPGPWDAIVCSDMLNLAEFLGLSSLRIPSVVYFHENQLTYPVRHESEQDYQFVFMNISTALAATKVWFNTAYHRDAFLDALPAFLKRMPDHHPLDAIERIRSKCEVHSSGIEVFPPRGPRRPGPLRILWSARWEHDKNPEAFFAALDLLQRKNVDFRVSVLGEQFRDSPAIFDEARTRLAGRVDRWGQPPTREDYMAALLDADVIVSTAHHETFGMAVVEAVSAGAYPLLPDRLSYPEILATAGVKEANDYLYDGRPRALAEKLHQLARRGSRGELWQDRPGLAEAMKCFTWPQLTPSLDLALERV
jgi:glycosyltransferase involved in cell wall biosynthesis